MRLQGQWQGDSGEGGSITDAPTDSLFPSLAGFCDELMKPSQELWQALVRM